MDTVHQGLQEILPSRGHGGQAQTQARPVLDGFVSCGLDLFQQVLCVLTAMIGMDQAQCIQRPTL